MSERFHDDPELDAFFADAVDGVEYEIDDDGPMPDLAAVVALAHAMDPTRVAATAVHEVAAYAPVVTLETGRRFRETRDDLDMNALVQQVRAHVDQEVARELSQPAGASAPTPMPARPAPRYWWVGVLVAAALVLGIGIGTVQATRLFEEAYTIDQSEALHSDREEEDDTQTAVHREPELAPAPAPKAERTPVPSEVEPAEEVALEAEPAAGKRSHKRRRAKEEIVAPEETLEQKLDRLDREAQAAWRAGQLDRAERLFTEIVKLDKHGKFAGMAYGDMFTIADRRNDEARQVRLWKQYLARFPRGRFADDARAGLCRAADGQARVACWTAYLEDMPRGSYRAQARRESGGGGTP
jgi:hypothetical protein